MKKHRAGNKQNKRENERKSGNKATAQNSNQKHRTRKRVTRVNMRLMLVMVLGSTALAVMVHFVRAFQMDRHAETLLARARTNQNDGEFSKAIGHLSRFLEIRPLDVDALAMFGDARRSDGQFAPSMESGLPDVRQGPQARA